MTAAEISILPPADFSRQVWALYRQALPNPDDPGRFNGLMREASAKGMRFVEALLYVVEQRRFAFEEDPLTGTIPEGQPCLGSPY